MRKTAAWIVYGVAVAIQWVMETAHCWFLYRAYSKLMRWSADIQGPSANGPWGAASPGLRLSSRS